MLKSLLSGFLFFFSISLFAQGVLHEVSISSGAEDADETDGFVQIYDLELDMGWSEGVKSTSALHFRNVFLENSPNVSSLNLSLTAQSTMSDSITLSIKVEDNPFPNNITDSLPFIANRSFLGDSILWTIPPTEKLVKRISPDLYPLVSSVLNGDDWSSASGLFLYLAPLASDSQSNVKFEAYSYDQLDSLKRPTLRIFVDSNDINGIFTPNKVERVSSFEIYNTFQKGILNLSVNPSNPPSQLNIMRLDGQLIKQLNISPSNDRMSVRLNDVSTGMYLIQDPVSGTTKRWVNN